MKRVITVLVSISLFIFAISGCGTFVKPVKVEPPSKEDIAKTEHLNKTSWKCVITDNCGFDRTKCKDSNPGNMSCKNGNCEGKCQHVCKKSCGPKLTCPCSLGLCYCQDFSD